MYLPNKKISNNNFIIALRNIIINYETKKSEIKRKDFICKTLIEYSKNINKNKFNWISYKEFKESEIKVIKKYNNELEIDVINELINSINHFNLNESENKIIEDNNNIDINVNKVLNFEENSINKIELSDIKKEENSESFDDIEINYNSGDDDEENNPEKELKNDDSIDYKTSSLFERLILNNKGFIYKDLIIKLNKNNICHKRDISILDKEDGIIINYDISHKKIIIYPKD